VEHECHILAVENPNRLLDAIKVVMGIGAKTNFYNSISKCRMQIEKCKIIYNNTTTAGQFSFVLPSLKIGVG
jgi:hypothetical protein